MSEKALRSLTGPYARERRELETRKAREANFKRLERQMFKEGLKSADDVLYWAQMLMPNHPELQEEVRSFDPEDIGCSIFGHCCPAFLTASGATETKGTRQWGRYISRALVLQVARRDNYICQKCRKHVGDEDLHLDHIIPVSRGGPTTAANLRLLCSACNRKKSDSLDELLVDHTAEALQHGERGLARLRAAIPSTSPQRMRELERIARDIVRRIRLVAEDVTDKRKHRRAARELLDQAERTWPGILLKAARPESELVNIRRSVTRTPRGPQ